MNAHPNHLNLSHNLSLAEMKADPQRRHPRQMGWFSTATLAPGGSNQSLFLIAALFVGQESIPGQGSAAVLVSAGMAAVYFIFLPLVWFGALGGDALGQNLGLVLGPTFAPLFGSLARHSLAGQRISAE